jgi:hypothetical protein
MKEKYLNQYQEEVSESSIINEDENIKQVLFKDSNKTGTNVTNTRPQNKFPIYTFDPKSVLKDTQPKADAGVARAYPDTKYSTNNYTSYVQTKNVQPDMSFLTTLGDNVSECRKTDEYKTFAKEFEKQYGNYQREMERVTNDLNTRSTKLDNFIRELQGANLDMILYRNRLVREIQDVQNDLKEAYNNILVLMSDRSTMRDQFCIFKMKIKKLKGFVKTFQGDIQA